jgi:hypothetical protein
MENIQIIEGIDGVEMVIIDRGDNEYSAMTKTNYEAQQAALSTPIVSGDE